MGTYTIEVSASAGCVTKTISYTLQILHFCEEELITIDCSNSIFLTGGPVSYTYNLHSGDGSLQWDNNVLTSPNFYCGSLNPVCGDITWAVDMVGSSVL